MDIFLKFGQCCTVLLSDGNDFFDWNVIGTLAFTHPQGGRVQVPISSGVVSKDSVTFSGQTQLPMGAIELTFHGKANDKSLSGTADMTLRALLLGAETNPASLNLQKQ